MNRLPAWSRLLRLIAGFAMLIVIWELQVAAVAVGIALIVIEAVKSRRQAAEAQSASANT